MKQTNFKAALDTLYSNESTQKEKDKAYTLLSQAINALEIYLEYFTPELDVYGSYEGKTKYIQAKFSGTDFECAEKVNSDVGLDWVQLKLFLDRMN